MDNMFVSLRANSDGSGNYTGVVGGAVIRLTTDADRRLFGMTDDNVKDAINTILGARPADVFYNDPTRWGNSYQQFGWEPVTLTLRPVSAVFTGINVTNSALATNEVTNYTSRVVTANVAFTTQRENAAQTTWSRTSTLSVTQSVGFDILFFGAETSISFSQEWQRGGSHTQTISIGSSVAIERDLNPGETIVVTNWGETGTASVRITYVASLSGRVFANYPRTHNGHHFWGVLVSSVLSTLRVSNRIEIVQDMNLNSYLFTRTTVGYPSRVPAEEQTVYTSDRLVSPADLTENLPEGVTRAAK